MVKPTNQAPFQCAILGVHSCPLCSSELHHNHRKCLIMILFYRWGEWDTKQFSWLRLQLGNDRARLWSQAFWRFGSLFFSEDVISSNWSICPELLSPTGNLSYLLGLGQEVDGATSCMSGFLAFFLWVVRLKVIFLIKWGEERGCWRISGRVTPIKPLMSILSHVNHMPFSLPLGASATLGEPVMDHSPPMS